ncbi:MAG TPA: aspartate/glutamate racemase [Parvularcula sp.]|nr:aspartate/glutamate racemase [Parvularcula sp.]HBS34933.1 aspartate/glutamate racemase [Parvularcula sp.]
MKTLGLIGGVSPESTVLYMRLLNEGVRARLGGEHSAAFVVWHLDYGVMIAHYRASAWAAFTEEVVMAGKALMRAGAEGLMITSNTTHVAADALAAATGAPVVHLVAALAAELAASGVRRPLLLGTPPVMAGPYYRAALSRRYDGEILTPAAGEQLEIERIILGELCRGVVTDRSRARLLEVIAASPDADAVILGCTELPLILSQADCALPVFDTTALHAAAGVRFALGRN